MAPKRHSQPKALESDSTMPVYYLEHFNSPNPFSPEIQKGAKGHAQKHKRTQSDTFGFPLPPENFGEAPQVIAQSVSTTDVKEQTHRALRRPTSLAHLKTVGEVAGSEDERLQPRTIEQWRAEAERYAHSVKNLQQSDSQDAPLSSPETIILSLSEQSDDGAAPSVAPSKTKPATTSERKHQVPQSYLVPPVEASSHTTRTSISSGSTATTKISSMWVNSRRASTQPTDVASDDAAEVTKNKHEKPRISSSMTMPAIAPTAPLALRNTSTQSSKRNGTPKRHSAAEEIVKPSTQKTISRTVSIEELYGAFEEQDQSMSEDQEEVQEGGDFDADGNWIDEEKLLRLQRSLELLNLDHGAFHVQDRGAARQRRPKESKNRDARPAQQRRYVSLGNAVVAETDMLDAEIEHAAPSLSEQLASASELEWSVDGGSDDGLASAAAERAHQVNAGPTQVVVVLHSPSIQYLDHGPHTAEIGDSWSRAASRVNSINKHHQVARRATARRGSMRGRSSSAMAVGRRVSIRSTITEDSPILSGALSAASLAQERAIPNSRTLLMSPVDVERLFGVSLSDLYDSRDENGQTIVLAQVPDADKAAEDIFKQSSDLQLPGIPQEASDGLAEFSYLLENNFFDRLPADTPKLDQRGPLAAASATLTRGPSALPGIPTPVIGRADQSRDEIAPKSVTGTLTASVSEPDGSLSAPGEMSSPANTSPSREAAPSMMPASSSMSVLSRPRPKTSRMEISTSQLMSSPVLVVKTRQRKYSTDIHRTQSQASDATVRPRAPPVRKASREQLSQRAREASQPAPASFVGQNMPAFQEIPRQVNPHPPLQRPMLPSTRVSFADQMHSKPMHRGVMSQSSAGISILRTSSSGTSAPSLTTGTPATVYSVASTAKKPYVPRQSHTKILRGRALDDVRQSCHAKAAYIRAMMENRGRTHSGSFQGGSRTDIPDALTPAALGQPFREEQAGTGGMEGHLQGPRKLKQRDKDADPLPKSKSMPTSMVNAFRKTSGSGGHTSGGPRTSRNVTPQSGMLPALEDSHSPKRLQPSAKKLRARAAAAAEAEAVAADKARKSQSKGIKPSSSRPAPHSQPFDSREQQYGHTPVVTVEL